MFCWDPDKIVDLLILAYRLRISSKSRFCFIHLISHSMPVEVLTQLSEDPRKRYAWKQVENWFEHQQERKNMFSQVKDRRWRCVMIKLWLTSKLCCNFLNLLLIYSFWTGNWFSFCQKLKRKKCVLKCVADESTFDSKEKFLVIWQ